ncbi:MAG TPA: hypothetical protein EYG85_08205 [Crocinitomix sp.]|nr:hypothetical protein [Crocinitomix sp.]
MQKPAKIVVLTLLTYAVLGLLTFIEKGFFYIPYHYNPVTVFIVSILSLIQSYKSNSFIVNLIYFIGILFYCFLSERTLVLFYHYTDNILFYNISQNDFTRLLKFIGFTASILVILWLYTKENIKSVLLLLFFLTSVLTMFLNKRLIEIISFSLFAIFFNVFVFKEPKEVIKLKFKAVAYQLLLMVFIEDIYFYYN